MKLDFPVPTDNKMHRYCIVCKTEGVEQVKDGDKTKYFCPTCSRTENRAIYFNTHKSWLDEEKTLWHESSVVFVRNKNKFLFYLRTEWPFLLTVPSGHVDNNETPEIAAARELEEEVTIKSKNLQHVISINIPTDSCSAGADHHYCHAFIMDSLNKEVTIKEEGKDPQWLTLAEAQHKGVVAGIDFLLQQEMNI